MNSRNPSPVVRSTSVLVVALALGMISSTGSAWAVRLDFEGVPSQFNYDGSGFNLGDYYASQPGGPVFGPQTTVLEAGGDSLNTTLFPPNSGMGVLWGERGPIEIRFSNDLASAISLYYRSNTQLFLYAFGADDLLLGSTSGLGSLAPGDPPGQLSFTYGSESIARVLIQDSGNFFVIDDLDYAVRAPSIPEPEVPAGLAWVLSALGLGALSIARRRCRC